MERNRRGKSRHHSKNWNEQKKNANHNGNGRNSQNFEKDNYSEKNHKKFQFVSHENPEISAQREKAIKELKLREIICPKCGKPITDIASAMADKTTGMPIHFDCAMEQVSAGEKLEQNEKIAYIGQGRFAVLSYENIRDQRHFSIKKIIEWESRDSKPEWRGEMSSLFSQVE